MAKTQYQINVAYNNALKRAGDLQGIANNINKQVTELSDCKNGLTNDWKGNNSSAYCSKIMKRIEELSSIEKRIRRLASTVSAVARNTYEADQKALALAKNKNK